MGTELISLNFEPCEIARAKKPLLMFQQLTIIHSAMRFDMECEEVGYCEVTA
jgi:hypothetical protein